MYAIRSYYAPHKLKGGVSGCIRECAEAKGKDFGLIATEKGYNLYVCGNGGITPAHAVLLASDASTQDCIKYLDRFLMYYIRTAGPLTRTSKWLTQLEGGIEHVKDVVINDSLGIAQELENDMQAFVDSFECEWTTVVKSVITSYSIHYTKLYDEHVCSLCLRTGIARLSITPWKSFLVKNIT